MKTNVSIYDFENAFRVIRPGSFSYAGLKALYEYLIDYEDSCDEEIKLDVIALCCDYTEYDDVDEVLENLPAMESLEDLQNNTQVIEFNGGIIIQDF